jgi:hypothetical protein
MSDKNGIAQIDKPVQLTWRNRRVKTRENDGGVFFLVEVEVDEESWGFLKTIPRNASGEMVVWVTEVGMITERPKREKNPKEKTIYGAIWKELVLAGFFNCPGVRETINAASVQVGETPHQLMRKVFGVESLSREVGPEQIYAKFPPDEYPQAKVMVEQALRKAGA